MKAVLLIRHGGPENLKVSKFPTPRPARGEAVVRVRACALNHLDIWVRMGFPGVRIPMPHILGCEVSGTVEELGPGVQGIRKGASVLVSPGLGRHDSIEFLNQNDPLAPDYQILGFQRRGGYAEFVSVPAENLIPVPITKRLTYEKWAAFPLVFLAAWRMLVTRGALKPGETALIHAAGSGLGQAALQIAKFLGARVIATAGGSEKCRRSLSLGADEAINYSKTDFSRRARELTGGRGVDLVFEHVGQATFQKSLESLRKGGRMVVCGVTSGRETTLDLRMLFMNQLSIHGSYMGSLAELRRLVELAAEGRFGSVIDSVLPLREARQAHLLMESRKFFGKIVLVP